VRIQRIQFLEKYAARAEDFLFQKYGEDYTSEDVEKLAEALINMDMERAAEIERVEEITKQARYTAKSFANEININLGDGAFQKIATPALIDAIKTMAKSKAVSGFGQKIMGGLGRAKKLIKTDPLMAAGIAGTGGAATIVGSELMGND